MTFELTEDQKNGLKIGRNRYLSGESYTTIAGFAGTGKAQPVDTPIPLADGGEKNMGDLQVGDMILDRHGNPTKVTGVFPQGELEVHTVKFQDGRQTRCNVDHLWTVYDYVEEKEITLTLGEIVDLQSETPDECRFGIPRNGPIRYSFKESPCGRDGYDLADLMLHEMYALETTARPCKLPQWIKYGSETQRMGFIRALIAKTTLSKDYHLKMTNFSQFAMTQLANLIRSVGVDCVVYNDPSVPAFVTVEATFENLNKIAVPQKQSPYVDFKEISFDGEVAEMVCISVDNEEQLYLTEDYIVTHNTTLVKSLVEDLGLHPNRVSYSSYTGRAAMVLREKGHRAITLHKLLYNSHKRKDGTFAHIPKKELDEIYDLLIVDEISMVPKHMWSLLLTHGVHVIALGDPFQLKPVSGEDNGVLGEPHIFLKEIMRQALDSDLVRVSMDIRNGRGISYMKGEDLQILSPKDLVSGMYFWADQILCGKNRTRRQINYQCKQLLDKNPQKLEDGDKLICLRNYWEDINEEGYPLVNGAVGTCRRPREGEDRGVLGRTLRTDFVPEFCSDEKTGVFESLLLDHKLILEGVSGQQKNAPKNLNNSQYQFDWGYAITVWKAQGSEYNKALIFAEKNPYMTQEDYNRFLYTAVTRCKEKGVIIV